MEALIGECVAAAIGVPVDGVDMTADGRRDGASLALVLFPRNGTGMPPLPA